MMVPTIDLLGIFKFIFKIARVIVYASLLVGFFSMIATIITGFVVAVVLSFGYVEDFLNMAVSGGDNLSAFFGFLSCIGFTQAFNDYMPLIISGIIFLFIRIVLAQFLSLYFKFLRILTPLLD